MPYHDFGVSYGGTAVATRGYAVVVASGTIVALSGQAPAFTTVTAEDAHLHPDHLQHPLDHVDEIAGFGLVATAGLVVGTRAMRSRFRFLR